MKRLLGLSLVLAVALAQATDVATVEGLVKDPAKFDNKVVTVIGKVSHFTAKTSRAGAKYFTFQLEQGKDHIAVYGKGELKPAPKDGNKVAATGIFAKERKVGTSSYKNELDVTSHGKDKFGVHIGK